jgi:hypothetical protein
MAADLRHILLLIHMAPAVAILTAAWRTHVLERDNVSSQAAVCWHLRGPAQNSTCSFGTLWVASLLYKAKIHHAGEMESRGSFSRKYKGFSVRNRLALGSTQPLRWNYEWVEFYLFSFCVLRAWCLVELCNIKINIFLFLIEDILLCLMSYKINELFISAVERNNVRRCIKKFPD